MTATLGVLRETAPDERRVALVPDLVAEVVGLGLDVLVEAGAGERSWHHDREYRAAGAMPTGRAELLRRSDLLLCVRTPAVDPRRGQWLAGMLRPERNLHPVRRWAEQGVTAIGLDLVPPQPAGEHPMDAAASQARIAGYRAVLLGAARLGSCLPPWDTGRDAPVPVRVLVVGAGPAGQQAIDTARRLGAAVHAVEPRHRRRAEAAALGAELLDLPALPPVADDARLWELMEERRAPIRSDLAAAVRGYDLVLTALAPPGRRPPVLLGAAAVAAMHPGAVLVDLVACPFAGNIEGAEPDSVLLAGDGVTVLGAGELAAQAPATASRALSRNALALLERLTASGRLALDPDDPVLAAMVVTHRGEVRHGPTLRLLQELTAAAGVP